jgi:hypothetical protein
MTIFHTALAEKLYRPDIDNTRAASSIERIFLLGTDALTALISYPIVQLVSFITYLLNTRLM